MMPVMDGLTCCKKIREDVRTAHIPVLMLTAREEEISILKADRMGADDYIVKPFNPILLRSKVKNLIAQRQRLKRIYSRIVLAKEGNDGDKTDDEFLQRAMRVIEANIANKDFNVKMLAGLLNVSQPTLYRKLNKGSGVNAVDLIVKIRMSKAAALIIEKRYSLQEIAEMVGYNDVRSLRKHFISQFGALPSRFLEEK